MKMTLKVMIFFIFFSSTLYAQGINELPMYGGKQKSPDLIKLDQEFVRQAIEAAGSREKAAQDAIRRGWDYIGKRDPKMAIKRFNQAWLLTPDNGYVFWGFAATVGQQGKLDDSIEFFKKANAMIPNNGRLLCDFGFSYIWKGRASFSPKEAGAYYEKAISLFQQARLLEPNYERIYSNWAVVLFFKKDYKGAWEKVRQAEGLGGKMLDKNFIDDLDKQMKRPY